MLQKTLLKPGVNRENTRYTNEGGWYEGDKIRFRQGNPETIGGWQPFTLSTFKGICRSLWNWVTLGSLNLIGLGTNLKYYIQQGGFFYDITPIRTTTTLGANPFTGNGTTTVVVTAPSHGCVNGDYVTFSGVTGTYATLLNAEYQVTYIDSNSYSITTASAVAAGATGGVAVVATYQLNTGPAYAVPLTGWGAGSWGSGAWGVGGTSNTSLRIWNNQNYGQNLVYGPRGGGMYYWNADTLVTTRGVALNTLGGTVTFTVASPTTATFTTVLTEGTAVQFSVSSGGTLPTGIVAGTTYYLVNVTGVTANLLNTSGTLINVTGAGSGTFSVSLLVDVPTAVNTIFISDTSRFVFAFGCNDYGSATLDPMLVRWSDQDNIYVWTPDATNQAGSVRLSHGSELITVVQTRQEIVAFTDSSVYSFQYLGPPIVWGSQLLGDNLSIAGPNAAVIGSGIVFWMGIDKFYMYDGRIQTLDCDLRRYVFNDFNTAQRNQVYCSTSEGFNEIWWFYPSLSSNYNDKYVVYNYVEKVWYYGSMSRSAWLDSGLLPVPIATTYDSTTQIGRLINHESGLNDNTDGTDYPLNAYISSSEFDIGDGHNFGFVWRIIPDLTFQQLNQ
jgi:hypothetical protein